jgi:hypothetical protein
LSYPVVEDTFTPIPAQHRLLPIEQVKAAYKAAGLELPEGFEPEDSLSGNRGADAGAPGHDVRALRAKAAEAELLLNSITEEV